MRTDKERLDFLQMLTMKGEYTGECIMRNSTSGRGWRLHETHWAGAVPDVRQAIDNFMDGQLAEQLENSHMDEKHNHLNGELDE